MTVDWRSIEVKWQKRWAEAKVFEADPIDGKPKFFLTVAYPYPNSPQHIGHGRTYTLADTHARFKRMQGYNVLFPLGFHYTGTPILAMAKRLADGDQDLIDTFTKIYRVPKEILTQFNEPVNIARYFHREILEGLKEIGYSIDFRREFTTVDPHYQRFIEWQFHKLSELGMISKGSHAVGWCPRDGNPVGQHDTRGDVEPEIEEFTLIKFRIEEFLLPTGTLRPETVFGVTNIWINPNAEYVKAAVDHEKWIVSKEAAKKLEFLNRKVEILERFSGRRLVGKSALNVVTEQQIPILPAEFVNPNNVTGVVMSVPAHAPYDLVALEDIKKNHRALSEFQLSADIIANIEPVAMISVEGYGNVPAAEVVRKMNIKDQTDKRLEDATKEVYRHEFHNGRMKENTGKYNGLAVARAKDTVKQDLISEAKADVMYEFLNSPVVCRCGTECLVKIFENQWFLDYGKPEWKRLAHECVAEMEILPEEMCTEFDHVVDWLREKACARKSGLGTRLPWDKTWIIESLSDSTIYMVYYLLAKFIKRDKMPPEALTDAVFDYVFLGKGELTKVHAESKLPIQLLEEMRREFLYFYPLDSRHSGRDLVSNHLTYFVFNHVAIFPKAIWPRQIVVNGSVLMEGQKMSKSLGNITPLREAIKTYGADALRISLLATAGLLQDADFSTALAKSMGDWLERYYSNALKLLQNGAVFYETEKLTYIDKWLISRLQRHIANVTAAMEEMEAMKACQSALYLLDQDLTWYMRRVGAETVDESRRKITVAVAQEALSVQTRILAPFIPHIAEEIWEKLENRPFISTAEWPKPDETRLDLKAEEIEEFIQATIHDTKNILRVTGIQPKTVYYYVAADWKRNIYIKTIEAFHSSNPTFQELMNKFKEMPNFKKHAEKIAKTGRKFFEEVGRMPADQLERRLKTSPLPELESLQSATIFLAKEFDSKVQVSSEDDTNNYDPKNKASFAEPYRPAIYIE